MAGILAPQRGGTKVARRETSGSLITRFRALKVRQIRSPRVSNALCNEFADPDVSRLATFSVQLRSTTFFVPTRVV
jgi:hypothetical protein